MMKAIVQPIAWIFVGVVVWECWISNIHTLYSSKEKSLLSWHTFVCEFRNWYLRQPNVDCNGEVHNFKRKNGLIDSRASSEITHKVTPENRSRHLSKSKMDLCQDESDDILPRWMYFEFDPLTVLKMAIVFSPSNWSLVLCAIIGCRNSKSMSPVIISERSWDWYGIVCVVFYYRSVTDILSC